MDQIKRLLESLTWKQILSLVLAAAAVIGALAAFARWNRERDFRPLYSSLAPEDAAAVLAKVRENGSEFRLSENGSVVLVPSERVAELRLDMAAAGLPKSGRIGFELFDKTTFGMSDFTEQVNYHRALEGELERSVMSLAEVEQARVHITFPKDSLFLDSRQPAKASVLVKLRPGAQLSPQNVAAICQLAASAVEGLLPEAVTVVDMRGNLLNQARKAASPDDPEPSEAALEYRQKTGARSAGQNQPCARTAAGRRQFSRHRLGRVRLFQRRRERGELRSHQVRHGQFAKDRGHERRSGGGGHSGHRVQPAPAGRAPGGQREFGLAPQREHQLPIQPYRAPRPGAARHREAHVGIAPGGFHGPLRGHRSQSQTDRGSALGG